MRHFCQELLAVQAITERVHWRAPAYFSSLFDLLIHDVFAGVADCAVGTHILRSQLMPRHDRLTAKLHSGWKVYSSHSNPSPQGRHVAWKGSLTTQHHIGKDIFNVANIEHLWAKA